MQMRFRPEPQVNDYCLLIDFESEYCNSSPAVVYINDREWQWRSTYKRSCGAVASSALRTENCVFEPSLALLARTPAGRGGEADARRPASAQRALGGARGRREVRSGYCAGRDSKGQPFPP